MKDLKIPKHSPRLKNALAASDAIANYKEDARNVLATLSILYDWAALDHLEWSPHTAGALSLVIDKLKHVVDGLEEVAGGPLEELYRDLRAEACEGQPPMTPREAPEPLVAGNAH